MKQDILNFINEIEHYGLSVDEGNLLNIIEFIVQDNEFDDDMYMEIYEGLENYIDDEDEELQGNFEEESDDDELEDDDDIDEQLIEKIVTRIRGGKKQKTKLGYRGGKKIKRSTILKQKRAAKKRSRKKVKSSTIRKRLRSMKKTKSKFRSFLKSKRKK